MRPIRKKFFEFWPKTSGRLPAFVIKSREKNKRLRENLDIFPEILELVAQAWQVLSANNNRKG